MREYYVYIMTNKARTLYVGVTNNLEQRVAQHKEKLVEGFTSRYGLNELAYYASTNDVREAIAREKQIKGWIRAKKIALIEEMNPDWDDLSATWFSDPKQSG
jgi:putative endonuclease